MPKVFISGSRQISFLPSQTQESLETIISRKFEILLGDSEKGVDAFVALYLAHQNYENVSIYTIHDRPRFGICQTQLETSSRQWSINRLNPDNSDSKTRVEQETKKDRAMGEIADYGLAIWQPTYLNQRFKNKAVSSGTLRNMIQLLLNNKPVVLFYGSEQCDLDDIQRAELKTLEDLKNVLNDLDETVRKRFQDIYKKEYTRMAQQQSLF